MKYGGYFHWIHNIKAVFDVYPKRFPLNFYGLIYGLSFLWLFYAAAMRFWKSMRRFRLFGLITLMGRNSLAAFVIHAYFLYLILIIQEWEIGRFAVFIMVVVSVYLTYKITFYIDRAIENSTLPRLYAWLFT